MVIGKQRDEIKRLKKQILAIEKKQKSLKILEQIEFVIYLIKLKIKTWRI